MIFNAKFEMFDVKINFKGLYPPNLLCPFCNVKNEDLSHNFNCKFGPVYPAFVWGLTVEHLHITDVQKLKCMGKLLVKYERMKSILI